MKKPSCSNTTISHAIFAKAMLRTFCVVLMTTLPAAAQQSPADTAYAVPDNVAPHAAPVQPLPMNHKTHLRSGLVCLNCHVSPDPGTLMTFPSTETCMMCHRTIATEKPSVMSLLEYSETGQPIPWVRVYEITAGVTWSHKAHVNAGTQCETCHGDMSQTEAVAETKAIRAMATCISCHEERNVPADCVTCHAWPTDQDLGFE